MKFEIINKDIESKARAGTLHTERGSIHTPAFMPVGTQGTVKAVHQQELEKVIQAEIILANTYHLYLRPGTEVIQRAGGIHRFINWNRPILTDSGGFQIYSLSNIRKIEDEGVTFLSHIDGSKHFFTPEESIRIQKIIGADIIMAFDECTPYPCEYSYAKESLSLTHSWLDKSIRAFEDSDPIYGKPQILAPIVQGSIYRDLRIQSAEYVAEKNQPINAIGGLSVGEPAEEMYSCVETVCQVLSEDKPRYLMGVGTPENLLNCIELGIDMFDCVLPTRNARHGLIYTSEGRLNIKNKKWESDFSPIDLLSDCSTSHDHSRAYLRHLFVTKEWLGAMVASIHNLRFYVRLMETAREKIISGEFYQWKTTTLKKISNRL